VGIRKTLKARSKGEFRNALAVFSCIEKDDSAKDVTDAKEEICKTMHSIKSTRKIVLVPFVHLSENIAPPEKAIMLLGKLHSQLESAGFDTYSVSFGYHKTFELHFKGHGHPLAVAFRSFPRR
jgi:threonyl-tRNA synthetase